MTLLAYIGPGTGYRPDPFVVAIEVAVVLTAFALIALYMWWAMREIGR